jgi:hypothetical protein
MENYKEYLVKTDYCRRDRVKMLQEEKFKWWYATVEMQQVETSTPEVHQWQMQLLLWNI